MLSLLIDQFFKAIIRSNEQQLSVEVINSAAVTGMYLLDFCEREGYVGYGILLEVLFVGEIRFPE